MIGIALALAMLCNLAACKDKMPEHEAAQNPPAAKQWQPSARDFTVPANTPAAAKVDAKRAMQYTKEIVAFGPRPIGSESHKKVEDYIRQKLNGLQVETDSFEAQTAAGKFPMANIIAKIPGKKDGIIVLASHYDTNLPLKNTSFVGANDGACTSALLIELANQLKGKERDGYSIWLVFTDGEEATVKWSAMDSLYGSKHLAEKWTADGTIKKIKAFMLLDMIGDKDLDIDRDMNSTGWLLDLIYRSASDLGYQSYFFVRDNQIEDDHLPFAKAGVPVADIIDIDYGYNNVFHHTPEDTIDKLSPESLKIVGNTVLQTIRYLDAH